LLAWLGRLVANPQGGLDVLDRIAKVSSALIAQFNTTLDLFASEVSDPVAERGDAGAEVIRQIDGFVYTHSWRDYAGFRREALDFCLNSAIRPEDLAKMIAPYEHFQLTPQEHLADRINADWPLRVLCRTYFLFWA
jgi:hypothetical protein